MPKSGVFAITARDFPNVFDVKFRENRLLGHAPSVVSHFSAEVVSGAMLSR